MVFRGFLLTFVGIQEVSYVGNGTDPQNEGYRIKRKSEYEAVTFMITV